MFRVLSLGAGVQSSTLALMIEKGEFPSVDLAIFADTGHEPESVYSWLGYLRTKISYPIVTVGYGNLASDALRIRRSKKSGKLYFGQLIPFFIKKADGKKGIAQRKCTRDYKIYPIRREIKKRLGIRGRLPKEILCEMLMGISTDEAHRMRDSEVSYIEHCYPLVERGLSRSDCLSWMKKSGYQKPPRSACYFCPYHSDMEWARLRDEEPEAFRRSVEFEKKLQDAAANSEAMRGQPFLHASLRPLEEVEFDKNPGGFGNECEGMCGF